VEVEGEDTWVVEEVDTSAEVVAVAAADPTECMRRANISSRCAEFRFRRANPILLSSISVPSKQSIFVSYMLPFVMASAASAFLFSCIMVSHETVAVLRSAQPIGVSVVYNSRDQATGEAFVEFSNEVDLQRYMLISPFQWTPPPQAEKVLVSALGVFHCIMGSDVHVLLYRTEDWD